MGRGSIADEMHAVLVCDKMHWTYDQFLDQPVWFIKLLSAKWVVEDEHAKKQTKKHGN